MAGVGEQPPFVEDAFTADRVALMQFIDDLWDLLSEVEGQLAEDAQPVYRAHFDATLGHFNLVKAVLAEQAVGFYLQAEGLTGPQLRSKLQLFNDALQFSRLGDGLNVISRSVESFKAGGKAIALKVANTILGSLSIAIPAAGVIKELKEVGENAVELTNLQIEYEAQREVDQEF